MNFIVLSLTIPDKCKNLTENEIPVVLMHGLFASKSDMYKLRDKIREDFPNRKVESLEVFFGSFSSVFGSSDRYMRGMAHNM